MADIDATKAKSTIFIGGIAQGVDEAVLLQTFSPFDGKHRGFAFVTFGTPADAQDAIDNMDMNELRGKVLKVSMAKPQRAPVQGAGNRAIWETEEWLRTYTKPLAESGGINAKAANTASADEGENAMEE
ncbi:hypothetical protein PIIN_06740 [Serendipita indica DSM 11827]|uniref:RRM domain-containing protein n=1 Tax=Serendipita indica (strain DSM 11827) TaxID=1109443 RepID=G4TNB1_SERID|nr:hypothetical protein PIIN_06740 [Serendipita indica DSM 11827]